MSTNEKGTAISKTIAVLIPVVIGSLLGLTASLATNYYTSRVERNETLRKERAQHIERAMMLASKFTNDVSKAIGLELITKGNIGANDISLFVAPTDTLTELNATVSLYFPQLKSDVEEIIGRYGAVVMRYEKTIDVQNERSNEDTLAFKQRIEREVTPVMERVRSLMKKLGDLAQTNNA
jgi:hypothetical protein